MAQRMSTRNVAFVLSLVALASVLQGCGVGPGVWPGQAPRPTPAPMLPQELWHTQVLDANKKVTLRWRYDADTKKYNFNLTAVFPSALGYLALGFSPDGKMANGDYIMGYMVDGAPCVRPLTNGAAAGELPTPKNAATLTDPAVVVNGNTMSIMATSGNEHIKTSGMQKVLYAAGSDKIVPKTCDAALTFANHHDLGASGLVGSANVTFNAVRATMEVGSCGATKPSKVLDCQNVDMGSCGNACCKLLFTVDKEPVGAMQMLNVSLAHGGPDGGYTLQMTAEGTLGFGDLRPFHVPGGEQFIGQVHHMTSGPKHYNDTIDFTIKPQQCANGVECSATGSIIKAFSLSLIGGALGDNGQNYKNIVMAMKSAGFKLDLANADSSCLPPQAPLVNVAV